MVTIQFQFENKIYPAKSQKERKKVRYEASADITHVVSFAEVGLYKNLQKLITVNMPYQASGVVVRGYVCRIF